MRELKWTPEQPAELSVLGDGSGGRQTARVLEMAGKRLRVAAEQPVKGGSAVRLEWAGQLLLGQVLNADSGSFWLEIHHMLDTAELSWQKQGWQRAG